MVNKSFDIIKHLKGAKKQEQIAGLISSLGQMPSSASSKSSCSNKGGGKDSQRVQKIMSYLEGNSLLQEIEKSL